MKEKIKDLAKEEPIIDENVDILLQTFIDSLIENTQNKKENRQKDKKRIQ